MKIGFKLFNKQIKFNSKGLHQELFVDEILGRRTKSLSKYLIYRDYIKATSLNFLYGTEQGVPSYFPKIVNELELIHDVYHTPSIYEEINIRGNFVTWFGFLDDFFNENGKYCSLNHILTFKELFKIVNIVKKNAGFCIPSFYTLLHGDLSGNNILIDKKDNIHFIDWGEVIVGDPIFDLANLATFFEPYSLFISKLYKNKGENFEIRFWTYFLIISIYKLAVLHKKGYNDLNRAKDRINLALLYL